MNDLNDFTTACLETLSSAATSSSWARISGVRSKFVFTASFFFGRPMGVRVDSQSGQTS